MRKALIVLTSVVFLLTAGASTAATEEMPTPGGGNVFGQHVAGMAPEHAITHASEFGACVSSMALGEPCPH